MQRIRYHRWAAFLVLAVSAVWVATGDFSSVGSAAQESTPPTTDQANSKAEAKSVQQDLRTVGVTEPNFILHNRIVRVSGVTAADKMTTLATRSAGVIGDLKVEKGDWVKSGDIILMLDGSEKQAAVETAKALLRQRENEAANVEQLIERGISPKSKSDDAKSSLAAARSQLEAAEAELDRLRVTAPFDGVIDSVSVEEASWAPTGQNVAVLLSLDPIIASGEISERERSLVKIGSDAEVELINGMKVEGKVRYISRAATAQTRTYPVEVAIANPDGVIPVGMTVEIRLKSDAVNAVKLPRSVVTLDADGNLGIRVVNADNRVGFVPIDLIDDTPRGLLLGGVPKDAAIIVAGQDLVTEGEEVISVKVGPEGFADLKTGAVE